MPLASNLNELNLNYGTVIAAGATKALLPRHTADCPLPDLKEIEACRSNAAGKLFKFYPAQHEKIAGALAGLKAHGRVWMICDCGTGKTAMSIGAAWSLLRLYNRPLVIEQT